MTETTKAKSYQFKAEITQLLDILAHSLYKEREIFLRELISNASDALTRIQFEMLTNQDVLDPAAELAIHIEVKKDGDEKKIIVKDSGIGMTREELVQNLGTIAQSGAREFVAKIGQENASPAEIIGQFGVGFYSIFMVADEVRVISRSFKKRAMAGSWVSSGGDQFFVEQADKEDRGTEIHIKLKNDADEFADEWKLKQIVKKYSDFVGYPIYVGNQKANQQLPLWRKSPSEVITDEYRQFYQQMTMDFEEPISTIHLSSDAPINLRALLFLPNNREKSVLNLRKEPGLKLYAHNVLIQEYCQDLLPKWLEFIDGVVDSEDLPLNISRESIQNTRIIRQLGKTLRNRVLRELNRLSEGDQDRYTKFWHQYERVLKEGLVTDPDSKDDILPLLRFYSSQYPANLTTLDAYIERMPKEQEAIYYVLGENKETVAYSPHLDPLKARNIEVLYLVDPIDVFMTPVLTEYKGKGLRNIDDVNLELPQEPIDEETKSELLADADFNRFIGRCVTTLGNRILEVRESKVLRDSPVRLVSPEDAPARDVQRLLKYIEQEYEIPKKILEINRNHPLIISLTRLTNAQPDDELINLSIEQLYENALVIEGLHPNPAAMLPRIQKLMEVAASRSGNWQNGRETV